MNIAARIASLFRPSEQEVREVEASIQKASS
jgi:hypothetical protein